MLSFLVCNILLKIENTPKCTCIEVSATHLVSCSWSPLQASSKIQIYSAAAFKFLPIAQLLRGLQSGSVSPALGCTNSVHWGNTGTTVKLHLWQTSVQLLGQPEKFI